MKSGMYEIKEEYKHLTDDVQNDIWYCITAMINSKSDLDKHYAKSMLNKYYNEPEE